MQRKIILLIEDDPRLREIMADFLQQSGFAVVEAADGREGLEKFAATTVDLVILDIMIPQLDGWSVCRRIRRQSDVPLVMLTARGEEDDKLMGYELGADDYITKPFSLKILVAKVKMLLKRVEGSIGKMDGTLTLGALEVNRPGRSVCLVGDLLTLAPKEYDVLLYLMENRGVVLSRESILSHVWGYDYYGDLRSVDTHIRRLRSKLGAYAPYLVTMIGSGYKFEVGS